MVEEDCTDVVQMAVQGEEAASSLIGPDLDLVVIAAGHEEWLCFVEVDAADRTVMLFEPVDQSSHAVVP